MKEKEFLKWIENEQYCAEMGDDPAVQELVNRIKIKYSETFSDRLALRSPAEVIEDVLARHGMRPGDLVNREYNDAHRMRVIKEIYESLGRVYTKATVADFMNVSPSVVYWATNNSNA